MDLQRWRRHFEERQHFDEDLEPDQLEMYRVTALLDTSEYHVFELAFRDWHARKPTEAELEPYFVDYMFNQKLPPWLRQYNRKVTELERAGELDLVDLGVYKRLPNRRMRLIGQTYTVVLLAFMLLVTYMAFHHQPEEREAGPVGHTRNATP